MENKELANSLFNQLRGSVYPGDIASIVYRLSFIFLVANEIGTNEWIGKTKNFFDIDNDNFNDNPKLGKKTRDFTKEVVSSLNSLNLSEEVYNNIINTLEKLSYKELIGLINTNFQGRNESSTPDSICDLIMNIAKNNNHLDKVLDITCGRGNFLLRASKFNPDQIQGIEINDENAQIAKIRLYANGIKEPAIISDDCFNVSWQQNELLNDKFDCVFGDFPWKISNRVRDSREKMMNANGNRFILEANNTSDYFFLSVMMGFLSKNGKAFGLVPGSTLLNNIDQNVRQFLAQKGYVESVIKLPSQIMPQTSIPAFLVVLSCGNKSVKFVDVSSAAILETRTGNAIDVEKAYSIVYSNDSEKVKVVSCKDLEKHSFSLSPDSYLKNPEDELPNTKKLEEGCKTIFSGWQVTKAKLDEKYILSSSDDKGTRLLQMSDIVDGEIKKDLASYKIDDNTLRRFVLQTNDVVISTKGLKVKLAVVESTEKGPIIASGSIIVIRSNPDILDPYFVKSFLESPIGQKILNGYQTGNFIPNLTVNSVKKLPIPFIAMPRQKTIGEKYKRIHDKILYEKYSLSKLERESEKLFDSLLDGDFSE